MSSLYKKDQRVLVHYRYERHNGERAKADISGTILEVFSPFWPGQPTYHVKFDLAGLENLSAVLFTANEMEPLTKAKPSPCYSDHNEDIRTKGSCDYCRSTSPEQEVR